MPALTAGQLTTLRSRPHTHRLRMSIINPTTLLTAQVAGSLARGATAITFDTGTGSGFASIAAGHTLKITNQYGDRVVRVAGVSGSQASGTITVDANDIVWEDNAALVIYENWQDYPLIARFTAAGEFFKNWSTTYSGQNTATAPVCIAGAHQVAELTEASHTFSIDLSDSYTTWPGYDIASYGLSVTPSAGVTVTDNGGGAFEVEITTAGEYWAIASVTDANGTSQTTYRRLILHSAAYPYRTNFTAAINGEWSRGGWTARIELKGAASAIQDYALVLLWHEQKFAGTAASLNPAGSNLLFAGYLKPGTARYNYDLDTVSFEATTVEALLRDHYSHALTLEAMPAGASQWYEFRQDLTSGLAAHHLLKWHSTFLEITDVYGLLDDWTANLRRRYAEVQGSDLYSMVSQLLGSIQAKLVCDKLGRARVLVDPQLQDDAARAAFDVVFSITKGDVIADTTIARRTPGASRVRVSGMANATPGLSFANVAIRPYLSRAPGETYVPRGRPPMEVGNQVVSGQDYTNNLAGRFLAAEQQTIQEVRLAFDGGYADVLDIADAQFYTMSLTGSDNPLGLTWTDKNIICRSVRLQHRPDVGVMDVEATFEPESLGPPGQTEPWVPDPPDDVDDVEPPEEPSWPDLPDIETPAIEPPEPLINTGSLITWGQDGVFVRYKMAETPDWIDKNTMAAGQWEPVESGSVDPYWTQAGEQETTNPTQAIIWRADIGVIYRSADGGDTWEERTPVDDPPNTWSDTTAPIVVELTFRFMRSDFDNQGTHYFAATWQEPDSGNDKWRSWLLTTTDNGLTWAWSTVFVAVNETTEFDFSENSGQWIGDSGYLVGQAPSGFPPIPATTYWSGSNGYSSKCSGNGPGNWTSDERGEWAMNEQQATTKIYLAQNCSFTAASMRFFGKSQIGRTWAQIEASSDGGGSWSILATNQLYGGDNADVCYNTGLSFSAQTDVWVKFVVSVIGSPALASPAMAIYGVSLTDFTTGPTELRIVYATSAFILAIADGELNLYDPNFGLISKIGDCTDAEYDAGTYSAGHFAPIDDVNALFVFGRFDCTNGDTGLSGAQHIIATADGGSTWASIESGWGVDHCGAFACNADDGSGRRYWAVRNTTGSCDLYSDIASLTLIGDIAAINVRPDTFVILDGNTMYAAGISGGATIVYQTINGGGTWADITGSHDTTSGIKRMSLL